MLGRCSHEFSWPRRGDDGDYYQVCLLCAAEYKYDWDTMRRTQRLEHDKPETLVRRAHSREKRPSWTPRARRLKLDGPLRFRINSTSTWYEGEMDNLSQTGLLFHARRQMPLNVLIELVFEMPEEISGQKNRKVLCQGRVIRCEDQTSKDQPGKDQPREDQPAQKSKTESKTESKNAEAPNKGNKDKDQDPDRPSLLAASIVDYKFINRITRTPRTQRPPR